MAWQDQMKTDALAIAFPDFVLQSGDEIRVKVRQADDWELSSVTFEPGFFAIDVSVWRPTDKQPGDGLYKGEIVFKELSTGQCYYTPAYKCFLDDEARDFFIRLMNGS